MRSLSPPDSGRPPDAASASLDAIYRSHARWLSGVVRRRFGAQLSPEDLVQDTYARLAGMPDETSIAHPRALLWRIANRLALDQLRRGRRAAAAAGGSTGLETCAPDQNESVLLAELIAALPRTCRDTFLLSRFAGLAYEEIARRQAISVKAVEWRISRALAIIARRLAE